LASIEENSTRVYTINLTRAWLTPQYRRSDRVINIIKEFAQRHMKTNEIKLDQDLNRQVWKRGKTNPPRKVRVKMIKDEEGIVIISLYEEPTKTDATLPRTPTSKEQEKHALAQDGKITEKSDESTP
jgi:large subunit ribosomal protein L31e